LGRGLYASEGELMVIRHNDKTLTICNCCSATKSNPQGWYQGEGVDYCPKCSKIFIETFQTKLARP